MGEAENLKAATIKALTTPPQQIPHQTWVYSKMPIWQHLRLWTVILNDGHAKSLAGLDQQNGGTGACNCSGFSLVTQCSLLLQLSYCLCLAGVIFIKWEEPTKITEI